MLWIVKRPISGDRILMTPDDLVDFLEAPDHRDLPVSAEPAFDADTHECSEESVDISHPLYPLVVS